GTPVGGGERNPKAHRLDLGAVSPATAAQHLLLTFRRPFRVGVRRTGVEVAVIPISSPFPDSSVHGEQPIAVGWQRSDGQNPEWTKAVANAARRRRRSIAPGMTGQDQPSPGCFFPLGFGR